MLHKYLINYVHEITVVSATRIKESPWQPRDSSWRCYSRTSCTKLHFSSWHEWNVAFSWDVLQLRARLTEDLCSPCPTFSSARAAVLGLPELVVTASAPSLHKAISFHNRLVWTEASSLRSTPCLFGTLYCSSLSSCISLSFTFFHSFRTWGPSLPHSVSSLLTPYS